MDSNIKRAIILDNYQNPFNRIRHDNDQDYTKINSRNVSCIDNIDLYLKVDNDTIEDITFDGEACVISISTTSVMSSLLKGKKIKEAKKIIENYLNMVEEKEYDETILKEALAYSDVSRQPSRKKCATLTWNGLYKKIEEIERNDSIE